MRTFHILSAKSHSNYMIHTITQIEPPFEVTETGWGEFDIIIKIHFIQNCGEKPLTLYHHLKLHPYEEDGLGNPWPKQKPVTSYSYDEIVFNEPADVFYDLLQENQTCNIPLKKTPHHQFSLQAEQEEIERIDKALKSTSQEIAKYRERCKRLEAELSGK
ncbi:NuA4 histone H4 acetyltransferase complex and the SWR1 complex subunit [Haplosporangium sp. Z 27]|nr:NuA4 histone H4 acetyltransferase complex and the SWR1 complex subunit [Haplosporangium sp. Z 27]